MSTTSSMTHGHGFDLTPPRDVAHPPHRNGQQPKPDDPRRMRAAVLAFLTFCKYNSAFRGADEKTALTSFHSVAEPPISLPDYVDRIDRHTRCGEEAVLIALVILGRFCRAARMLPSALSAHRLMLISVRLAVKAHHDVFRSNKTYASAGGLRLPEFNQLEFAMVTRIDFSVLVRHEELEYTRAAIAQAAELITQQHDSERGGTFVDLSAQECLAVATRVADAMQPRCPVASVPPLTAEEVGCPVAFRYEASEATTNASSTPSTSSTKAPRPLFLRGSPTSRSAVRSSDRGPLAVDSEVDSKYAPSEGSDALTAAAADQQQGSPGPSPKNIQQQQHASTIEDDAPPALDAPRPAARRNSPLRNSTAQQQQPPNNRAPHMSIPHPPVAACGSGVHAASVIRRHSAS